MRQQSGIIDSAIQRIFINRTYLSKLLARNLIAVKYYNLNCMLSHLYSRKTVQKPPQLEESSQEVDIINSFYQQRKARSFSAKQHNLLKKNISFFQQQSAQENSFAVSNQGPEKKTSLVLSMLRRPPLDLKHSNHQQHSLNQQLIKTKNRPSLPKSQYHSQESLSRYSIPNALKSELSDSQYRQHLKNQLNKRVNINTYLSELNPNQKNQTVNLKKKYSFHDTQSNHQKESQINNKFDKFNSHYDQTQAKSSEFHTQQKKKDKKQKTSSLKRLQIQRKITNQSKNSRKNQSQQLNKCYQISKNQFTDRTQVIRHTFGSQKSQKHSKSLLSNEKSNRSAHENSNYSQKQQQLNRLNSQQLSELHYNSHPLRENANQPTITQQLKLKYNYFDPEQQAHYKRRIQDLQKELEQLKAKHKRQQKFIDSIVKMRRTIDGRMDQDDEYSLKQLWRWIKQLPSKKY